MRIFFCLLLGLFLGVFHTVAQSRPEGKVHRLPEGKAVKTISLNPEYYVVGKSLVKGDEKLPLLIYLHGGGGTGTDIAKVQGQVRRFLTTLKAAGIDAIVVAPQATLNPMKVGAKGGWVPADLNVLLAHLLKTLPVDADRVYLTGNSMGGYGTYAWAGVNPEHFAAIAPMVGGIGALGPKDITPELELWGENLARVPMRAYYGAEDRVVPADRGAMVLEAIEKAGGEQAEVIVFDDMGHNAGQRPYSDPAFFRWLFGQERKRG